MTTQIATIRATLEAHGIPTRWHQGQLQAADDIVLFGNTLRTWIDVTDWNSKQVRAFLGY